MKSIKSLILLLLFLFPSTIVTAETNQVQCTMTEDGTLVISGNGAVTREDVSKAFISNRQKPQKLVVCEGITTLKEDCFVDVYHDRGNIKKIVFPNSLKVIESNTFTMFEDLKEIKWGNGLKKIGENCFSDCKRLETIAIPKSVTHMGKHIFSGCKKLTKITLPQNLQTSHPLTTDYHCCPVLKVIKNPSKKSIPLDDYKGHMTWYVNGQKVQKVPPKSTAKSKGKKIQIKYKLHGGKVTGKLPKTFRYGDSVKLPKNRVKKKGYVFLGWYCDKVGAGYVEDIDTLYPGMKECILSPMWYKIDLKNTKPGTVDIVVDGRDCVISYDDCLIRYSDNKNMKNAKLADSVSCKEGVITLRASNLEKEKKYYFQIKFLEDQWEGYWMRPKVSIQVKK